MTPYDGPDAPDAPSNFGLAFPETEDKTVRDIEVGDWVLILEDGERRFEPVTATLWWGEDGEDITVQRGHVGTRHCGDHVFPVAVDPDDAREWQARQDGQML